MTEAAADVRYAKRYSILAAVMLSNIMGPIDASIVNVVLPTITESFGVDIPTAQWVPMVYLLTIGSLLLFYGRLGDIIGYRRVYLAGLMGFVIASGLCGLAPSVRWLIAFRAVQGLAAGMMMAVAFAIITAIFPPDERGKALGISAISVSAGLAIGPSLGGLIAFALGWRYVFLINLPIGIAGYLWVYCVVPEKKGQPGRMDMPGVVTTFICLLSLLLFINRLPRTGFSHGTILLLLVAIAAGVAFLFIESTVTQPILNLGLFRNATFSSANAGALLNFASQYVIVFLTPFYLQRVLHYPSNHVGLVMTAFPLAVMVVAPISGALSDRIGTRAPASIGAGICALALFLLSRLPVYTTGEDVMWRLALFGFGTGIFQSPNNSAIMGSAPRVHLGIASGVLATMRIVGMVLGIAVGGAVLDAFAADVLLEKAALEGAEAAAFLEGLEHAYLAGAIMTAAAGIASLIRDGRDRERGRIEQELNAAGSIGRHGT